MSPAKLIAARDPMGFKPLCMGEMSDGSIVFSSESCAFATIGAKFVRDILPGEIVVIENGNIRTINEHIGRVSRSSMCLFEYIYFSRPDSILDGISAHDFRENAGRSLSIEHPVDADIVIGVPDSGLEAARGFAKEAGIPYEIGLIKNKYVGRSFIAPDQGMRVDKVHMKLSAVSSVIKDKRVVLIDDSIVRGTTSKQIVKMVRDAGAKEIHMRISSPPFLNPCYYGTDIDSKENLIACKYTLEEIRDYIGADSLGYLSVDAALSILHNLSKNDYLEHDGMKVDRGYCTACFDGKYPTDIPKETDKLRFEI
jgi:amidophosphoribosyltransferase